MARLRSRMYDQGRTKRFEQALDTGAIADIHFVVREIAMAFLEPMLVPSRVTGWAEEISPHIIVNAVNVATQPAKVLNDL